MFKIFYFIKICYIYFSFILYSFDKLFLVEGGKLYKKFKWIMIFFVMVVVLINFENYKNKYFFVLIFICFFINE